MKEQSALSALADIMATEKEIKKMLLPKALYIAASQLHFHHTKLEARQHLIAGINEFLDKRAFSQFGRKKTIDWLCKRALQHYDYSYAISSRKLLEVEAMSEANSWVWSRCYMRQKALDDLWQGRDAPREPPRRSKRR